MTIRIVTDSTADLDSSEIEQYGITVVPLMIHFGSQSYRAGIDIQTDEFYRRLRDSEMLPRTSQPSPAAFQSAYESLRDAAGIVSVHISGKLSGTLNSARAGVGLLESAPPVELVDTNSASMGLGFAVLAAARAAAGGADLAAVAAAAREAAAQTRLLMLVDTLEYLQKGGRIGKARAFLGTVLKTKPLLELRDGVIEPLERPRTRQRATERLFDLIVRTPEAAEIVVLHGSTPEEAKALAQRVRETLPGVSVRIGHCSPVIGVHTGPGALGAAILRSGA